MKYISRFHLLVCLFFLSIKIFASDMKYNYKIDFKTKYIGKLGTTVDNKNVVQPYLEMNAASGFYSSLWLNIPLKKDNPKRSLEIEPSIGYKYIYNDWRVDTSLTYMDLQNPKILDFSGDVLNSKVKLSKNNHYLELLHYRANKAKNGWLMGIGTQVNVKENLSLSANIRYSDGPFSFEPMYYGQFYLSHKIKKLNLIFTTEILKIFKKKNGNEQRDDEIAFGVSYKF